MNLSNLSFLDFAVSVCGSIITLFLALPAYKRTKEKGFLFWCIAAVAGLWNTITLHTIGANPHTNPAGYIFTCYSYRSLYVVDAIFAIIGTVLVITSYLALFESRRSDAPDTTNVV